MSFPVATVTEKGPVTTQNAALLARGRGRCRGRERWRGRALRSLAGAGVGARVHDNGATPAGERRPRSSLRTAPVISGRASRVKRSLLVSLPLLLALPLAAAHLGAGCALQGEG